MKVSNICKGPKWDKKLKQQNYLIWHATIWVIRKTMNDWIFNNKASEMDNMVEQVKAMS